MSLFQKVKLSSIYTILGQSIDRIGVVFITWLLVRELALEEYGIYSLLLGMTAYLSTITSFGLIPAFRRYLPEFIRKNQIAEFLWTVRFVQLFRAVAAIIVISVILFFFDEFGAAFQISGYLKFFIIFAIGIFFFLQTELLRSIMEAMFLHKYITYSHFIYVLFRLVVLYIIFHYQYGLMYVLLTDLAAYVILFAIASCFYIRNNPKKRWSGHSKREFSKSGLMKRLFRYSGFSFFNEIGKNFIDISTDFFVISHFLGPGPLGYYAFAARIGSIIANMLPSRILRGVILPAYFSHYSGSGSKAELDRMFKFITKLNAFICFPIFAIVGVLGENVIRYIFDPKYVTALPVMLILFVHFLTLVFPFAMPLEALEKPEVILISKFSSIYNLIMDIILIQFWGIIGVAIATSSSIILKKFFEYHMAKKHAEIRLPWRSLAKIFANCGIVSAIGLWSNLYIDGVPSLLSTGFLLGILYLLFSFLNKPFLAEERVIINKMIGRNYFVF